MNENKILPAKSSQALISSRQPSSFMQFDGGNSLIAAAMPLLLMMIKFRQMQQVEQGRIFDLRHKVIDEIIAFAEAARKLQYSPRAILAARYCLCTALDEAVLSTHWGNGSTWSHQTLLSIMQKETWGGERFFLILEEMAKSPVENLPLLELLYLILSLGFEGRYYDQEQSVRDEVKHRLYQLISIHKEEPPKQLSPSLQVLQQAGSVLKPKFSKWKMLIGTLILFGAMWIIFNVATWSSGHDILQSFSELNQQLQTAATSASLPAVTVNPASHDI